MVMRQVRLTFHSQGSDAKGGGVDPVNSAGAAPRGVQLLDPNYGTHKEMMRCTLSRLVYHHVRQSISVVSTLQPQMAASTLMLLCGEMHAPQVIYSPAIDRTFQLSGGEATRPRVMHLTKQ